MKRDLAAGPAEIPSPGIEGVERCARDGCGNALPVRESDDQGRRKGGRRARFCSAACRAAAHRARTVTHNATTGEALRHVGAATERLLPLAEQWTAQLSDLTEQLRHANQNLIVQTQAAEQHAEEARAAAADSEQRVTEALNTCDAARRNAAAEAEARQRAEAEAERQREHAQQVERLATQRVDDHEAARKRAEQAARDADQHAKDAIASRDEQATHMHALQTESAAERRRAETRAREQADRIAELERLLAERDGALKVSSERLATATTQVEAAHTAHEQAQQAATIARADSERARERLEQEQAARAQALTALNDVRLQLATTEATLKGEQAQRQAAEARVTDLLSQRDNLNARLNDLMSQLRERERRP
ncbi:hypothetical protein ABT294_25485 [Nonomuraea sp. NPDC000554]|uniref:hypothetical protein n=1 Tax=Nonomuraea sp. NPDC000554 TaxID=3154259 RepID=UPI003332BB05